MTIPRTAKHSAMSVEWYSPPWIVERARSLMGGIDLDPASCADAQRLVRAERWFDREAAHGPDGSVPRADKTCALSPEVTWAGRVYLNPPGGLATAPGPSRSAAVQWFAKLAHEWAEERCNQAVFVAFTVEFLQTVQAAAEVPEGRPIREALARMLVCIPSRRTRFLRMPRPGEPDGALVEDTSPTHANAIVWLPPRNVGTHPCAFHVQFGTCGLILGFL